MENERNKTFEYSWRSKGVDFGDLSGVVISSVFGLEDWSEEVIFNTECGRQFKMHHQQCCCESVVISDVCGDPCDLVGAKIVHFEERTSEGDEGSLNKPYEYCESFTWTFYDIQTTKGCVNIRWLGESNGCYSECVDVDWGDEVTK